MRLRIPYRQIPACLLFFSLLASGQAQAGALPWLSQALGDPFAAEKKADHLIAPHLVPASCPEPKPLQRRLHLNDVVIAALCNNPDTRAAYLNLLGQADTYATNYAGYLPSVTATGGQSRTTTFSNHTILVSHAPSYGVAAGLTLYDFGQREFKLEIAEQALIAAGYSYDATLQGMIATALETYFRVLTSQNAVTAAAESEHYARQSYEAARLRHKIGQVPRADELQAKGAYSQAVLASQQARNQLSLDAASLAQLMGLSADASVEVAEIGDAALGKDPFAAPVRALMEQAKRKRNDLLAARAQVEGSKESLEALRRADLATVSATTSLNYGSDNIHIFNASATHSQAIGISVSIPIFTGFSQTYNERATERQLQAQEEELFKSELGVEQDVWNAWHNYSTAKQSWDTSRDLLASATQLKDVALGRYKEGLGTILDVLNAESQYTGALQSQLQSRYNLLATRVDLIRAVGIIDLETLRQQAALSPARDEPPATDQP